jgi:GNAT superfamily N-acetyltransferase
MVDTIKRAGEDELCNSVRVLNLADLDDLVRIDTHIVGHSRRDYLALKLDEAMKDTRIRVSLGVEVDGHLAGFLMGRLYYGEFGVPEPVAILDTIAVDPGRRREGIGRALLSQYLANLRAVGIHSIQTHASWDDWDLMQFLAAEGFSPAPRVCLEAAV